jgi:hypothetical protein
MSFIHHDRSLQYKAAAILINFESPFIILAFGIEFKISISVAVILSTTIFYATFAKRTICLTIETGLGSNFNIHSCIAFTEAFKIFISSIIKGSRWVTANEMHCCSIIGLSFAFSDNCLLSFSAV